MSALIDDQQTLVQGKSKERGVMHCEVHMHVSTFDSVTEKRSIGFSIYSIFPTLIKDQHVF